MSAARLLVATTLLCLLGVASAQSPPATPATGARIFQDPPAAAAGETKSGAPSGTDASAKKTFNESRSNSTRTPGDAKAIAPTADASAKKTFNESRSNALRTPGDAKAVASGADPSGNKSYYESRSNTANRATVDAKAAAPETPLPVKSAPAPSTPK